MITNKKFCLSKILKGGLPCPNPKIQWVVPHSDCLTSPCDSCTDECIELTMLEGCDANCVHVIIECPDCDSCAPQTHKVCFCNDNEDCGICETCSSAGVCVEKCEHCDETTGECGECSGGDCPGDLECIQGKCQCPPGSVKDGEICRYCTEDSECGPCRICTEDGKCVPKDCGSGVCDPLTGDCIGCTNSGHCGPNEICDDGDCVCAPGYVYDPVQGCIPQPPCESDSECGPCMKCTSEGCVPITCPDGKICVDGECVDLCNCDEPSCSKAGYGCQRISSDLCACLPCEDDKPCTEIPCNNGLDCPDGWGCKDGICVPCSTLNCGTGECDEVLGCECVGSRCMDSDNKCSGSCSGAEDCGPGCTCYRGRCVSCDNFACPDECGNIEGCGCQGDGTCGDDGKDCSDTFEINKRDDNCQIEGVLVSEKSCQCPRVSMNAKVHSVSSPTQFVRGINFLIELRKGDADEEGILNLPLLRDTGIANEFPLRGDLRVRVIEKLRSSNFSTPVGEDVVFSQVFSLAGVDTIETGILNFNPPGFTKTNPRTGGTEQVGEVEIQFVLDRRNLRFANSCEYSEEQVILSYRITANGGNGFIKYSDIASGTNPYIKYKVLQSDSNRNPVFFWYKSGDTGTETMFRSSYPEETSPGVFRDGWLGVDEGVEIGKFYRLEADCACDDSVYYTCPESGAISKLRYCNPKNLAHKLVFDLKDCNKTISFNPASNTFPVCEANSRGGQVYELYLNGRVAARFTAANGQVVFSGDYTASSSITEIEVRLAGHNCEKCYEVRELTPAEIEVSDLSYDCDLDALVYSVSGGSGNYSIHVDGVPYTILTPIKLDKGEHTVVFTDTSTGCTQEGVVDVDCCSSFRVVVPNITVCSGSTDIPITFTVENGVAPYHYTVADPLGLDVLAEGDTNQDTLTINPNYQGVTGVYRIKVVDSRGCGEDLITEFQVSEGNTPVIEVVDDTYCSGAASQEFTFNVTGISSYLYTIRDNSDVVVGPKPASGSFSETLVLGASHNYSVTVVSEEIAGCESTLEIGSFRELSCPPPTVDVSNASICVGQSLIVKASISGGIPYADGYDWEVEVNGDERGSGQGSEVSLNVGTSYSSTPGTITVKVKAFDSKSPTAGEDTATINVLSSDSPDCCCNTTTDPKPDPALQITRTDGGQGNIIGIGDFVELSVGSVSAPNYGDGEYVWDLIDSPSGPQYAIGNNKAFYPNTGTVGVYTFMARYKYSSDPSSCCEVSTVPYSLIIDDVYSLPIPDPEDPGTPGTCDCSVSIKVNSGIPNLNGKVITASNASGNQPICYGDGPVSFSAVPSKCSSGATYNWAIWSYIGNDINNRLQYEAGTGDTITYTPVTGGISNTTLYVSLSVGDGPCNNVATSLRVPVNVCASPDPFSVSFTNTPNEVCEAEEGVFPVRFRVNAGAKPSGGYDTFPFTWKIGKLVGTSFSQIKAGTIGSSSWGGSFKDVNEIINIGPHVSPSNPVTLQVRVERSGEPAKTVSKQVISIPQTSGACSTCPDMNLRASVNQAPSGTIEIEKGSQLVLTGNGAVDSPFTVNISKYTWTWAGGSYVGKTLSGQYPTVDTEYTLTIEQNISGGAKCTASTTVNVTVKESCKDTTQSLSWSKNSACPGEIVSLNWSIGTNYEYALLVNDQEVSNPSNPYVEQMPVSGPLVAKLISKYSSNCPQTVTTATVSKSTACCYETGTLTGNTHIFEGSDGMFQLYKNSGDFSGYTYEWRVNGSLQSGQTSEYFTYTPAALSSGVMLRTDTIQVTAKPPVSKDCSDIVLAKTVNVFPQCSTYKIAHTYIAPTNCNNNFTVENLTLTVEGSYKDWNVSDVLNHTVAKVEYCISNGVQTSVTISCVPSSLHPIKATWDLYQNGSLRHSIGPVTVSNTVPCFGCGELNT